MTVVAELFATLGLNIEEKEWLKGEKLIEFFKHGLEVIAGFEAVKGLAELVQGAVETASQVDKMSQKLGISVEAVQELGYAAHIADLDIGEFQVSMQFLARNLDNAIRKGGDAGSAFRRLGLSTIQLKGKSADQVLGMLADKFAKLPNSTTKTALAMEIFGRSGAAMIPFLNKGSKGIAALRQEAEELGVVIDKDAVDQFGELEESEKRLGAVWKGIKTQVALGLLPVIKEIAENTLQWVMANRELIKATLHKVINAVAIAAKAAGAAIAVIAEVINFLSEHTDVATALLVAFGTALLATAVDAAIAWIAVTGPIALVVAALAAVVYGVMEVVKHWDKIKAAVKKALRAAWEAVKKFIHDVLSWFASLPGKAWDAFKAIGNALWDALKDALEKAEKWFIDFVESIPDRLKDAVTSIPGHLLGGAKSIVSPLADAVGGGGSSHFLKDAAATLGPLKGGGQVVNNTTINVHSNATDPKAVADETAKKFNSLWDKKLRDAHAGLGGDQ